MLEHPESSFYKIRLYIHTIQKMFKFIIKRFKNFENNDQFAYKNWVIVESILSKSIG